MKFKKAQFDPMIWWALALLGLALMSYFIWQVSGSWDSAAANVDSAANNIPRG